MFSDIIHKNDLVMNLLWLNLPSVVRRRLLRESGGDIWNLTLARIVRAVNDNETIVAARAKVDASVAAQMGA